MAPLSGLSHFGAGVTDRLLTADEVAELLAVPVLGARVDAVGRHAVRAAGPLRAVRTRRGGGVARVVQAAGPADQPTGGAWLTSPSATRHSCSRSRTPRSSDSPYGHYSSARRIASRSEIVSATTPRPLSWASSRVSAVSLSPSARRHCASSSTSRSGTGVLPTARTLIYVFGAGGEENTAKHSLAARPAAYRRECQAFLRGGHPCLAEQPLSGAPANTARAGRSSGATSTAANAGRRSAASRSGTRRRHSASSASACRRSSATAGANRSG